MLPLSVRASRRKIIDQHRSARAPRRPLGQASVSAPTLNPFRRTRAAAEHGLRQAGDDTTMLRFFRFQQELMSSENAVAHDPGSIAHHFGRLREAAVELLGSEWLREEHGDADLAAVFGIDRLPSLRELDERLASLLSARYSPASV